MKKKYAYGLLVLVLALGFSLVLIAQNSKGEGEFSIGSVMLNITDVNIGDKNVASFADPMSSGEGSVLDEAEKQQLIFDYYHLSDDPDLTSNEYIEHHAGISDVLEDGINSFDEIGELNVKLDGMLLTDDLSRTQKSFLLWELIVKEIERTDLDYNAIDMLVDSAYLLNPIEIAEMVIAEIDSGRHDLHVNGELIKLLGVSHYLYQDLKLGELFQEDPHSANIIVENGEKIIEYFDILLLAPASKEILPQVVKIYPRIASSDKHDLLLNVLDSNDGVFSDDMYLDARLQLALSNRTDSELGLTNLIRFVSDSDFTDETVSDFNDKLIRHVVIQLQSDEALTEEGRSENMFFSDSSKYELERYFASIHSDYPMSKFVDEPVTSAIQFRDWFLMTSLLKTNTKSERINYTLDYMLEAQSHHRLALVVGLGEDGDLLREFQENTDLLFMLNEDFGGRNNSEDVSYIFSHFQDLAVIKELLESN